MKRLFINIFMLFSSFFLFSGVKAATLEPEIDLSLINENFYNIKELAEEFVKNDDTYSDDFIIYYQNALYVSFYNKDNTYVPNCSIYNSSGFKCFLNNSNKTLVRYAYNKSKNILVKSGSIGYYQNYVIYKLSSSSLDFVPLYSTLDFNFNKYNGSSSIIYNYKGYSSTINDTGTDKVKTLYDINYEYNIFLGNKDLVHQDENQKIKGFYDLCIEKIGYLATVIVGNYIYLSIFAIFILIFIFSLIKRRYL